MDKMKRSERKHNQIVKAARKLFLEAGFDATSMDAIAKYAEVSKRTAYNHFQDKNTLFAAVMEDVCRETCPPNMNQEPLEGDLEKVLKGAARQFLIANLAPQAIDLTRIMMAESKRFPELGKMYWETGPDYLKTYLSDFLANLDNQGIVSVSDPDLAAIQFIGMIKEPYFLPLIFGFGQQPSEEELDASIDNAVSIFLEGIVTI